MADQDSTSRRRFIALLGLGTVGAAVTAVSSSADAQVVVVNPGPCTYGCGPASVRGTARRTSRRTARRVSRRH